MEVRGRALPGTIAEEGFALKSPSVPLYIKGEVKF